MCNNFALITKFPLKKGATKADKDRHAVNAANKFDRNVLEAKLSLVLGRSKGSKGTGVMHNGRRIRSHDYHTRIGKPSKNANHDSLQFIESLYFFEEKSDHTFKKPDNYHVFMGHNRAPSSGHGAGEKFVHPFEYGEEATIVIGDKEVDTLKNRLWFQHNGTITNARKLASDHGLNFNDYGNDSFLIGTLIYNGVDPSEIFKAYEGACTCIWYWEKDNTLNVFKGGTKNSSGVLTEERELYMYQNEHQIMFNTQPEILNVVKDFGCEDQVTDVPINRILTIDTDLNITYTDVDRKYIPKVLPPPARKVSKLKVTALHMQSTPRFPDDREAVNQMVWYTGLYYFNRYLSHGIYKLDKHGRLDDDGIEYCFFNGYLLRDIYRFEERIQGRPWTTNWFHNNALHKGGKKDLWYTGRGKADGKVNPIMFYNYDFKAVKGKIRSANEFPAKSRRHIRTGFPKLDQIKWLANYNYWNGTEFENFSEIRGHYQELNQITSLFTNLNKMYRIDFTNICEDNRIILEDPICELYNQLNHTAFLTRFQCQQDYFNNEGITNVFNKDVISFYDCVNVYLAKLDPKELHNNLI